MRTRGVWAREATAGCARRDPSTGPSSSYARNYRVHGTHEVILGLVPSGSRVLDVGCATGYLGAALAERGCLVWGLDRDPAALRQARGRYRDLRVIDLEEADRLPWPERYFDVIIGADILEHLRDPGRALRLLHRYLQPEGRAIVSVPNVAHLSVRIPLLFGRFRYGETGILDRTHLRLFTFKTARELVESCGFRVERALAGSDRFGLLLNRFPLLGRILRGALAYGVILVCRRDERAFR